MRQLQLNKRPLWFEPFLQQLKKELGYPFDISKYAQLLKWANDQSWSMKGLPMQKLYGICRVLFLQDHEHEPQFKKLFFLYLIDELAYEQELVKKETAEDLEQTVSTAPVTPLKPSPLQPIKSPVNTGIVEPPDEEQQKAAEKKKKYLNLFIPETDCDDEATATMQSGHIYNFSADAYLPLTKREMLHGWRQLRKRESYIWSNRLDVRTTVQQIASEGILLKAVFEKEQVNSDDLLLILIDCKGSMTPFHHLSSKLVEAAVSGGGHRNALVYYFYNCPAGVVYRKPSLTDAVPLETLYSEIRPNHTNALIISDAGAARGGINELRIEKTNEFLYGTRNGEVTPGLHKSALFVVWINPMPRHRWVNTTAATIAANLETPMFSLMDDGYSTDGLLKDGYLNFLQAINKLMGR
jgi:hypothetical protein